MRTSALAVLALLAAASVGIAHAEDVEDIDNKQGKLGRLSPQIGTYHYDAVLNDPTVSADLLRRLGPKGVAALKARMAVEGPIAFDGTTMVLKGLMAHAGGTDEAIMSVRPHDGQIEVAMLIGGRRVIGSIDQFMPQFPADDVQKQAVAWAKAAHAQVVLVGTDDR